MNQEQYGETIRNYRKKNGLSQQALASHLGFTREHVSQIETGTKPIKLKKLQRIINAITQLSISGNEIEQQVKQIMKLKEN